jgi:two-component system response regulator
MTPPLILLLEDDADEAELMRIALRQNRFEGELAVVKDGQDALDFIFRGGAHAGRDRHQEPRLMLLDMGLPGIGGPEVLRTLKSDPRSRAIPAVVLSSSDDPAKVVEAYALGANAYLRKPPEMAGFVELVGALVRFWLSPDLVIAREK